MISRFEKIVLIILAGLGAGWWGYGLLLYLSIPGEYKPWFGLEMLVGTALFLIYDIAIIKRRIERRTSAWILFVAVLIIPLGLVYLIEGVFNIRRGSGAG